MARNTKPGGTRSPLPLRTEGPLLSSAGTEQCVQEGGFGLAQETIIHPEDVRGSGMWRECNDRGLATRRRQ